MGRKNFLIEGVSGTGKSSVCSELKKQGYSVVDGDNELAYQGDPDTGEGVLIFSHQTHIWKVDKLEELLQNDVKALFFCGGSRNWHKFIDKFDQVFVLMASDETITQRLNNRKGNSFGKSEDELKLILELNHTQQDVPDGIKIDADEPLANVVAIILELSGL